MPCSRHMHSVAWLPLLWHEKQQVVAHTPLAAIKRSGSQTSLPHEREDDSARCLVRREKVAMQNEEVQEKGQARCSRDRSASGYYSQTCQSAIGLKRAARRAGGKATELGYEPDTQSALQRHIDQKIPCKHARWRRMRCKQRTSDVQKTRVTGRKAHGGFDRQCPLREASNCGRTYAHTPCTSRSWFARARCAMLPGPLVYVMFV